MPSAKRILAGYCIWCGGVNTATTRVCQKCRGRVKEKRRANRAAGICTYYACGITAAPYALCQKHRAYVLDKSNRWRAKAKQTAVSDPLNDFDATF